ncbi:MAG: NAD(P)-dependent oxidoreductase [Solirubrobacterales bacterium]|nr:NAD(P)-dependent oxidoreductase [Solirubrobacterales bacterium]
MRIFLAGGTGAIGRPLVRRLVARGHHVTATTRSPEKAGLLRSLGAEPAVLDGLDGVAVGEAVARAEPDAIIHQMTGLAGISDLKHFDRTFAATNELRTTGTEHLLDAARAAGVGRFVAQSYAGWTSARTGGPVKDEDDPLEPDPPAAQAQSLAAIRRLEELVLGAPLTGTVLRYGGFYGPGAWEELLDVVRRRRMPLVGDGAGVWSWIHVEDAAAATVAAVEAGVPGVFNVVDDDPAPVSAWLPHLARAAGARPPRRVPVWLGRLAAGEVVVSMMTQARGSSNAKIRRELGWEPMWRSWRDGFLESREEGAVAA